jgi:Calcineurin-like phosphoesterase
MASGAPTPPARLPPRHDDIIRSERKIEQLRQGRLPQMVDWFDPSVLAMVGLRNMISATIGDYADQRPMQAAADQVGDIALASRHDYREVCKGGPGATEGPAGRWSVASENTTKSLAFDAEGALWVDFIADLGDGFEATYAMAYLMAQSSITPEMSRGVKNASGRWANEPLPAGDILIFGGDLAYPNATITEYNDRCIDPYNAAFQLQEGEEAKRKLFFIAGNHDWYDGLGAFTSVFCAARDRFAKGKGKKIGGWQCEQRRSYFALALPHGWWFWGVDLALNETVDDAQKNYFELMSEQTKPGDKIIIILHAPVWQTNPNSPLHDVSQWARNRGAEVVAVIAGDLHFYSRYQTLQKDRSKAPDLQLITSGGGGAFAHPTHQLPRNLQVHWTVPKDPKHLPHAGKADYKDTTVTATADEETTPISFQPPTPFDFHAPHIYPSKTRSSLLSLKNLWLPFHNRRFAMFLGVIYVIYAWVFQIAITDPGELTRRSQAVAIEQICARHYPGGELKKDNKPYDDCKQKLSPAIETSTFRKRVTELEGTLQSEQKQQAAPGASAAPEVKTEAPKTAEAKPRREMPILGERLMRLLESNEKIVGEAKEVEDYLAAVHEAGGWSKMALGVIWPSIKTERVIYAMFANPAFFFMIVGLYLGLIYYVDANFKSRRASWVTKIALGIPHAWCHIFLLLATNTVLQPVFNYFAQDGTAWWVMIIGVTLYSALMIAIGGVIGGMVFGLYWVLTSVIGRMHMDAFSALGVRGYKNFLRMRIDKDKLTIFPIGLDKVPGRRGWRELRMDDDASGHNPLIRPKRPLKPHLIEPPIEILAPAVRGRATPA